MPPHVPCLPPLPAARTCIALPLLYTHVQVYSGRLCHGHILLLLPLFTGYMRTDAVALRDSDPRFFARLSVDGWTDALATVSLRYCCCLRGFVANRPALWHLTFVATHRVTTPHGLSGRLSTTPAVYAAGASSPVPAFATNLVLRCAVSLPPPL